MKLFSDKKDRQAVIKSLSALSINLSAGWFGVVVIAPNFWPIEGVREVGL